MMGSSLRLRILDSKVKIYLSRRIKILLFEKGKRWKKKRVGPGTPRCSFLFKKFGHFKKKMNRIILKKLTHLPQ